MGPTDFAKIFHLPHVGQVVVFQPEEGSDDHEGMVVIAIYTRPPNLGICSMALAYDEWEKADEKFAAMDAELATVACETLIQFSKRIEEDL